jgi:hypothetical protein
MSNTNDGKPSLFLQNLLLTCEDTFFAPWRYLHCFTVARPLWEAPSSFDFFRKWKTYHVVENFDLEKFVKNGRAEDVDDFSKVQLVT